ncbi:MAG: lamin tail domain-containing protein [Candidatus Poribacteria bacterium]|nr:lamin tail domain-containing protein [Candidatus Poribacteria bacterium]
MRIKFLQMTLLGVMSLLHIAEGANFGEVVISELMWMGDFSGTSREWLELNNRTAVPIDLSGWELTRLSGGEEKLMLTIPEGIIPPRGYFLISNNSAEDSNLAVEPDLVDTAVSLVNSKLQIRLYDGPFDAGGNLIDVADDGVGAPAAGDKDSRKSMVRIEPPGDGTLPQQWVTAAASVGWDEGAAECGTPTSNAPPPVGEPEMDESGLRGVVLLSELMWMGDFDSSRNEWMKLWNRTDAPIDLSNWTITSFRDGEESLMLTIPEGMIPPLGFVLIANSSAEDSNIAVAPDLVTTDVSLPNSRLQLKLYDSDGVLIDVADDGSGVPAAGDNETKRSMVRHLDVLEGQLRSAWYTSDQREGWDVGTEEFGSPGSEIALPVQLSGFLAIRQNNAILLRWQTASEVDILGWDVYRSPARDGEYEKINGEIIQATAGVGAAQQYEYIDPTQDLDQSYYYYIESIGLNGERERSAVVGITMHPTPVSPKGNRIALWGQMKLRK